MANLQKFKAKLCYTASGTLIWNDKILLIKHKKLGLWMCPGGHMDQDEAPHTAAEREFFEETGIKVRAKTNQTFIKVNADKDITSEFLPSPLLVNLHWVNKESYDVRTTSNEPDKRVVTPVWKRGCEQHLNYLYLVEPVDITKLDFEQNLEETDGIAWFSKAELKNLEILPSIRQEIELCFECNF